MSGFIHVLLAIAVIVVLVRIISGRRQSDVDCVSKGAFMNILNTVGMVSMVPSMVQFIYGGATDIRLQP
jgi:hypothetical protein